MKVILATNNVNKIREFNSLFPKQKITSLKEIGFDGDIVEDGLTFKDNALIKARYISKLYNCIAISDDSGLEVEALNNEPGVYSARYAGNHDDDANNRLLIKNLIGVENRNARYVCAICIYHPDDTYRIVEGICKGQIIDEPKGTNGFGYDPYFYFEEFGKTFAEIPLSLKNEVSHRANALRMVLEVCNEDFSFK